MGRGEEAGLCVCCRVDAVQDAVQNAVVDITDNQGRSH